MSKKFFILQCAAILAGFVACSDGSGDGRSAISGMVWIEPGIFPMGSPDKEPDRNSNEAQHWVELTQGFSMGKHPVTQAQYRAVMGYNDSYFRDDNQPVERVTWYDAIEFCNKLSEAEGLQTVYLINNRVPASGYPITDATVTPNWKRNGYRLPTEAQWEYACRAGTTTAYNTGAVISGATGWYDANSGSKTHPVGQKPANKWGLYDMHGNVFEWCWDWYAVYPGGTQTDPEGPGSGADRVVRGGSWNYYGRSARSAYRAYDNPDNRYFGFRLVCP